MEDIPEVDIDSEGKFKYILIKVAGGADILERVEPHILKSKLSCECVGGGRIEHLPAKKTIRIYGYSQGYGQADHSISCALVKKEYPEYTVTWSNDGY
ncbi:PREDICTED: 14 kDa phosphohistidine phosphatase-like [Rhagoletis zephyria]|uniref:14 kDa phosphohistidine phosphatase-like n=1 Tax=Rhagoletis zephyria TaxID=28612 RepID=UPI000811536F|nr:PREDICTED: 14 kDa phosphohistidine phosphatase-like [Rhagoletis zephyria]